MRLVALLCAMVLAGCESMEGSGNLLAPVSIAPEPTAAPAPTAAPRPVAETFDFDADAPDPNAESDEGELDPNALAAGLGLAPEPAAWPEPEPAVADVEPDLPPEPVAVEPSWLPGDPMAGSWGVRLVSTVPQSQPPRAILGMPDGSEAVVQPGTLLPDHGLVVMAVGVDAVEVAEIVPVGDHVKVKTRVLHAMYGSRPRER